MPGLSGKHGLIVGVANKRSISWTIAQAAGAAGARLALTYQGLGRFADEAVAWERFITLGAAPEEACPGLADAYPRNGDGDGELRAYERCADLDPRDPERLLDLGDALERARRPSDALEVYRRAAGLDPRHPVIARRIDRVSRELAGTP